MFYLRNIVFIKNPPKLNFAQFRTLRKIAKVETLKIIEEAEIIFPTESPTLQESDVSSLPTNYAKESSHLNNLNNNKSDNNDIIGDGENKNSSLQKSKTSELDKFAPTYNLGAYLNKSETLQQLFKLGVDFSRIEKRKGLGDFILKLDFDKNVKSHLIFFNDIGILPENFGELITKNPLIFKVEIDDLKTRINYLEAKKFEPSQIQRICTKNPYWLMFSTKRIDKRLSYFQKEFKLTGDDIRYLVAKQPRLITYHMESVQANTFTIREEMGFDKDEIKCLLLNKPRLWMMSANELIERFDFVHNTMNISHDLLVQSPEILTSREYRIRQRHEYLKSLGLAQYDPKKELYVSLKSLVEGNDEQFVINIAKSNMKTYDMFLKTL